MDAVLQFEGMTVDHLIYKRNNLFWKNLKSEENHEQVQFDPVFNFKVIVNPNNYLEANVIIGVNIGNSKEIGYPFEISAGIKGFFNFREEVEEDITLELLTNNAIAILFPYLRSVVIDITSKGDHQPIVLPILNILETVREYKLENEIICQDSYEYESYEV